MYCSQYFFFAPVCLAKVTCFCVYPLFFLWQRYASIRKGAMNKTLANHSLYNLLPVDVEGFMPLAELALDMRWAWNHATDKVWRQIDPDLWDATNNPWIVLMSASRQQLEELLADPAFRQLVDDLVQAKRRRAEAPAWFQHVCPQSRLTCVA